jgi:PAS domain S-box-containing protein
MTPNTHLTGIENSKGRPSIATACEPTIRKYGEARRARKNQKSFFEIKRIFAIRQPGLTSLAVLTLLPHAGNVRSLAGSFAPLADGIPIWIPEISLVSSILVLAFLIFSLLLRRQVQQKTRELRASQENYQLVFENSGTANAIFDLDYRLTLQNSLSQKLLGGEPGKALGKSALEIFGPEIGPTIVERLKRVSSSGVPESFDTEFELPAGNLWFHSTYQPIFNENRRIVGTQIISQNITERKKVENALRESETRMRAIFESSHDAIGVSLSGTHYLVNPAYVSMFGYDHADELIGTPILNLIAPECHNIVMKNVQARARGEEAPSSYEVTALRKDGSKFLMDVKATLYEQGGQFYTLVILRDISERREAERSLLESRERFQLAMDASQDGLWDWDVPSGHVYFSPAYFTMLGYPPDHFPSHVQSWMDLIHPDDHIHTLAANLRCIENESERFEVEFRLRAQDNSWHWILGKGKAVKRDENGRAVRMVGTHTDITDRKQAEEQLHWNSNLTTALAALYPPITRPETTVIDIARAVLVQARWLTGSQHGYVSEIDPLNGDNVAHTLTDMLSGACEIRDEMRRIAFQRQSDGTYRGLWGHSLNTRQAFFTNEPAMHPTSIGVPSAHIALKQFLSVPVLVGEEVVGQIALADADRDYTESDLESIRRLAEFYALAIQRKRIEAEINHLSSFPELSPHPIIETDGKGRVLYINPAVMATVNFLGLGSPLELLPPGFEQLVVELQSTHPQQKYLEFQVAGHWYSIDATWMDEFNTLRLHYGNITERKNAEEKLKAALRDREILLRELYHRTKNNMQVISSMLNLEAAQAANEPWRNILLDMDGRIHSMSLVHQKLYQSRNLSTLDLRDYISDLSELLLESYQIKPGKIQIHIQAEPIPVLIDSAIPCGLIVNEILSNAFKYAFPGEMTGQIFIELARTEENLISMKISDNGVGIPAGTDIRNKNTLGVQTIFGIASHQLGATVELHTEQGVSWQISFSDDKYGARV